MPIDVLADRHNDFCFSTREAWLKLWKEGFSLLRHVSPPIEKPELIPLSPVRDGEEVVEGLLMHRYRLHFGGVKQVSFVRVRIASSTTWTWEPFIFVWTDSTTGENRRSVVYSWVLPRGMWTAFWIDGPVACGDLFIGRGGCQIGIDAVEYVARPTR